MIEESTSNADSSALRAFAEHTVQAVQALGWQSAALLIPDQETGQIRVAAFSSRAPDLDHLQEHYAALRTPPPPSDWTPLAATPSACYAITFADHADDVAPALSPVNFIPRRWPYDVPPGATRRRWQAGDTILTALSLEQSMLGWLAVTLPARQRPTPDKIRRLEQFAPPIALGLRHALHSERMQAQFNRQTVLNEIAQTIGQHLDMSDLFAAVTAQIHPLFDFQRASIILRGTQGMCGRTYALDDSRRDTPDSQTPTALEELACSQIVAGDAPYLAAEDLTRATALPQDKSLLEEGWQSYICLPLRMWGQVLGAFNLAAQAPRVFRANDVRFLTQIADHLASAVWNTLLYELEQKRRYTADALAQLAKLVNATLDLDEVFDLALEQIGRIVSYDTATIMLTDGERLRIAACRGFKHPDMLLNVIFTPEEDNIAHHTMHAQGARVEPDVQLLPEWGHNRHDVEGAHTIRSWIGSPLIVRGQSIGIVTLDKYEPDFYTDEDGETVTAFAAQIATAIHNARLYHSEQRKRQTATALARVAQLINSTLKLDDLLELALKQLDEVVDYDSTSILLQEGTNLILATSRGFSSADHINGMILRPDEANYGYGVIKSGQLRYVPDVQAHSDWAHIRDYIPELAAIRSWIGIPLTVRRKTIGALTIDKRQPDFYTQEDLDIAETFASQLATAIQNARLYQATQKQRDRLSAILTDTTDAVIVLDEANTIWLVNPAAERSLKIEYATVVGQPLPALAVPELIQAFEQAQQAQKAIMHEIAGPDNRAYNANIAPVHGVGWVVAMQDITPLKELDRLRTEWVAAVSHDLKNPIQAVQFGAALLEMDGPLNEDQSDRVKIIQRSAEQLSGLVTDVLDLARLEAGATQQMQAIDAGIVLDEALSEVEHLALNNNQVLELNFPDDLPLLWGNQALLVRALVNLLGNAIKYSPAGGTIGVHAELDRPSMRISVSDQGPGIADEDLPHIFDRFYRAPDRHEEGTGLGLSIVKSIVEKHNGDILIATGQDRGSTFTLVLPLAHMA